MQPDNSNNILAGFNQLATDYKAEVVAAALLDYNYKAENIYIRRLGISKRPKNKDIKNTRIEYFDFDQPKLIIETNREGMYDYMPEGVFHKPSLGGLNRNKEDILETIRQQRKAEQDSRKFFIPFELEANYAEMAALYYDSCLDRKAANDELLEVLNDLWPILSKLDKQSAKIFIHMLPFFYSARGNKKWFERCMEAFLGCPVKVTDVHNKVAEMGIDSASHLLLGNNLLGIDTLLCGDHFDGYMNWKINIGPVPTEEVKKYIKGSSFNDLLQVIYEHCIPVSVTPIQNIITIKTDHSFTLPLAGYTETYLGYTTFL